jgi:protein SCO1
MTGRAIITAIIMLLASCSSAFAHQASSNPVEKAMEALKIPDIQVRDQNGREINFYSDLVRGKTVVINFIFTSCTSVCPLLSTKFQATRRVLAQKGVKDVKFISISIDPSTDNPAALNRYAQNFGADADWTFVTGEIYQITALLKSLGASIGTNKIHSDFILLGDATHGRWTRRSNTTTPEELAHDISEMTEEANQPEVGSAAYFTNLSVVDQDGTKKPFYNTYIRGRLVAINFIYTNCTDICPLATENMVNLKALLAEKLGSDVLLLSVSIDPEHDTAEVLQRYRKTHGADWTFVTGKKQNLDWISYRLGAYSVKPAEHSTVLILGNDRTGEWRKLVVTETPNEIALQLREMNDIKSKPMKAALDGRTLFENVAVASTNVRTSCAGCHGFDGKGSIDGGQRVPPIRWDDLAQPRLAGDGLSERPAYDAASFARALRHGESPARVILSETMPRFNLDDGQVTALIGYLHELATQQAIGVSNSELHLGAALPLSGRMAPSGKLISEGLKRKFELINSSGGIYGRKLVLHTRDTGESAIEHRKALDDLLETDHVLGIAASFGHEENLAIETLSTTRRVPVLSAFNVPDQQNQASANYAHYLLPSLEDEAIALTVQAIAEGHNRIALLAGGDLPQQNELIRKMKAAGAVTVETMSSNTIDLALIDSADAAIVLEPPNLAEAVLLRISERKPSLLLLSSAGLTVPILRRLPVSLQNKIRLSTPFNLTDVDKNPIAILTDASADLIIKALRAAGRDVSREAFDQELQRLQAATPSLSAIRVATLKDHLSGIGSFTPSHHAKEQLP